MIFTTPGTYYFNLEDSWGDGANGGGFEIVKAAAGSYNTGSGTVNPNPIYWWDPGVAGLLTTQPGYRGPYNGYPWNAPSSTPVGYSNTMDGVLIQNNGATSVGYQLTGIDQWGDGWNGNWMRAQVAPIGSCLLYTSDAADE